MPITFFTQSTNPTDNGTVNLTALPITTPTNMVTGDLVIWVNTSRIQGNGYSILQGGGQTWNTITSGSTTTLSFIIKWARFNGTWIQAPTMSITTGTATLAQMLVFRPTAGSNYWFLSGSENGPSGSTFAAVTTGIPIQGFTSSYTSSVVLGMWASTDDNTWQITGSREWTTASLVAQYRNNANISTTYAYYIITGSGTITEIPTVNQREITLGGDTGRTFRASWYEAAYTPATYVCRWIDGDDMT